MLQTSTARVHIAKNIGSLLFQNGQNLYWIFLKDYFFVPLAKEIIAGRQVLHLQQLEKKTLSLFSLLKTTLAR